MPRRMTRPEGELRVYKPESKNAQRVKEALEQQVGASRVHTKTMRVMEDFIDRCAEDPDLAAEKMNYVAAVAAHTAKVSLAEEIAKRELGLSKHVESGGPKSLTQINVFGTLTQSDFDKLPDDVREKMMDAAMNRLQGREDRKPDV